MTTPEQGDQAAIERDDALLDAVASGAPVDDDAAMLLAEIAREADAAAHGDPPGDEGSPGEGGGGRRIRTIWGVTLGVSVAIALGSGLSVAANGELAPHAEGGPSNGFVVPAVPPAAVARGTVTVTVVPSVPDAPSVPSGSRGVSATSAAGMMSPLPVAGTEDATAWTWQLARDTTIARSAPATHRADAFNDPTAPLGPSRAAPSPHTYSHSLSGRTPAPAPEVPLRPVPSPSSSPTVRYSAPVTEQPYRAPTAAPMSATTGTRTPTSPTAPASPSTQAPRESYRTSSPSWGQSFGGTRFRR
ncbi:hypothetical protein ACFOYW_15460 [Gryllotalpicola reticulitermitis]|uniref:Uncharacterized protein n=1 Tax=Gryllotalpicola reticulitermitis TaxID=1184153 RepID=A0ABV8Q8W3_9MICO